MDIFHKDGHLTDTALDALVCEQSLDELTRLEISEHLAFCDLCLQRYTDALTGTSLLTPEHSCQESLWARLRARTLRLLTSRYATAAAAVVLALTVLWSSKLPFSTSLPDTSPPSAVEETVETLPDHFDAALKTFSGNVRGFFEHIGNLRQSAERNKVP